MRSPPGTRPAKPWYEQPAVLSASIGAAAVVLAAIISGTFGVLTPQAPRPAPAVPTDEGSNPLSFETFLATMTDPGLTDLQRRAFLDEQLHRRVEWEGSVRAVKPGDGDDARRYLLELAPSKGGPPVASCWFTTEWGEDLLALRRDQKITVSGVLESWAAAGPTLVDCRVKRL